MRKPKSITSSSSCLDVDGQDQNQQGLNTETGIERNRPEVKEQVNSKGIDRQFLCLSIDWVIGHKESVTGKKKIHKSWIICIYPISVQYWQWPTISLVCFLYCIFVPCINIENSIRTTLLARESGLCITWLCWPLSVKLKCQSKVHCGSITQVSNHYLIFQLPSFEKAILNHLKHFCNRLVVICFKWRKFCNWTGIISLKRTVTCMRSSHQHETL